MQAKIQSACLRVARCLKRAPAALRRRLGKEILSVIDTDSIDLELLEAILCVTRSIFEEFPNVEPAKAGLESLKGAFFCAISATSQSEAERAIAEFKAAGNRSVTDLFAGLAAAFGHGEVTRTTVQVGRQITQYVAEIAEIWRKAGLQPTVSHDYLHQDPSAYRSEFHQFVELIITWAMGFHRSERYDVKPWSEALQNSAKYKWFVSYSHIRAALRADSNFASKNVL